MRRFRWLFVLTLCLSVIIATALAARAEPTIPDSPTTAATTAPMRSITSATKPASTLSIATTTDLDDDTRITNKPSVISITTAKITTAPLRSITTAQKTTAKTTATKPSATTKTTRSTERVPLGVLPTFYEPATDENGNVITEIITIDRATTELTYEEETYEPVEGYNEADNAERKPINWKIAIPVAIVLAAALVGILVMLQKNRKDDDE